MIAEKVSYVAIDNNEDYYTFCINKLQWKRIRDAIDYEIEHYEEVRVYLDEKKDRLDIEGHCMRRKK